MDDNKGDLGMMSDMPPLDDNTVEESNSITQHPKFTTKSPKSCASSYTTFSSTMVPIFLFNCLTMPIRL